MSIYLDDQPVDLSGDSLAEVLSSAHDQLAQTGRIVVEVSLDGETLAPNELDRQEQQPVSGGELRLYSADPRDLSRSTLEGLLGELDQARQLQTDAAEQITQDQLVEAMDMLGRAMEIWQQTHQAVSQSLSLVGIDLDDVEVEGQHGPEIVDKLVDQLKAMRDTIQGADSVGLADALAYEWPEIAELWQKMLASIIEKLDEID